MGEGGEGRGRPMPAASSPTWRPSGTPYSNASTTQYGRSRPSASNLLRLHAGSGSVTEPHHGLGARAGRGGRDWFPPRRRRGVSPCRGKHRSEEHTSELQSPCNLVCRLLLEKKKK